MSRDDSAAQLPARVCRQHEFKTSDDSQLLSNCLQIVRGSCFRTLFDEVAVNTAMNFPQEDSVQLLPGHELAQGTRQISRPSTPLAPQQPQQQPQQQQVLTQQPARQSPGASPPSAHGVRPSAPNRTPSNTYAPARKPNSLAEVTKQRSHRSSSANRSGARKQLPHHNQRHDSNSNVPRATDDFEAQQRFYLRKMRDDLDDEYYTRGISQLDDSDSEDDSPQIEFPNRGNVRPELFYSENSFNPATTPSREQRPSTDELQNPKNRERLEWQAMLTAVLTGEVVRSEKRKLQTGQKPAKALSKSEFWLEIRARACGRSLALQRKIIEESRAEVDQVLEQFMNFQIQGKDKCPDSPEDQIKDILRKLDKCESLWSSSAAMAKDKPIAQTLEFHRRCEALISWVTVSDSIHSQIEALKKWTGDDDLDLTRNTKVDEGNDEGNGNNGDDPFIERLFKESDVVLLFHTKILAIIGPIIVKAKQTTIEQGQMFAEMHLPSYLEELLTLLNFPTRLIQEIIRTRLSYSRKLMNPTMMIIDQMIDVYKVAIQQAVLIKKDYLVLTAPEEGWELPTVIDENFDNTFLEGLSFYIELLNRKLFGNAKSKKTHKNFRESEFVEGEWMFLSGVGEEIDGADLEVAEQISMLTGKLLARLMTFFEKQLKGPSTISTNELLKLYSGTIEHVQGYLRKLLRFSRYAVLFYIS